MQTAKDITGLILTAILILGGVVALYNYVYGWQVSMLLPIVGRQRAVDDELLRLTLIKDAIVRSQPDAVDRLQKSEAESKKATPFSKTRDELSVTREERAQRIEIGELIRHWNKEGSLPPEDIQRLSTLVEQALRTNFVRYDTASERRRNIEDVLVDQSWRKLILLSWPFRPGTEK